MVNDWHRNHATNKKIKNDPAGENIKIRSANNIPANNLGNDIFLSRSGQAKIDNLVSCLSLSSCDFIVF